MEINRIFITLLFFLPNLAYAVPTFDQLKEQNPEVCKGITKDDGYQGFLDCTVRLRDYSERKLQSRLLVLRQDLDTLSLKAYRTNFERDQTAWEAYKKSHCAYVSTGMEKRAYDFQLNMCNLMENYKRLETLEGEPAFP